MQISSTPIVRDIVLIGGGHSHVGVLRRFGMHPEPGVRLTVICTDVHTPYSGMLPGYIAGHYSYDDVHIDLSRLAVFAGARLVRDAVVGIDRVAGKVLCASRPPIAYDCVSINVGSTPQLAGVPGAQGQVVPVKPIYQFNQRWLNLLARVQQHTTGIQRIAVVGAGAGGVELLLAMHYRLRRELQALGRSPDLLEFHLVGADATVLTTHNAGVRRRFATELAQRGVVVHLGAAVTQVSPGQLHFADGSVLKAEEIMWVTQAGGAAWLQDTGLALDAHGFVVVNDCLQSLTDPKVFAAGDVAAMQNNPLEKAGVFAVRMGKPLADNLRRTVQGKVLKPYHSQRRWLALISTGDRYAVGSRGALGFAGAWVWHWKDWIDRGFMRKFAEFPEMAMGMAMPAQSSRSAGSTQLALTADESLQAISAIAMRCGGCGAKVGATVLSRALQHLQVVQRDEVVIGLHAPDDAAVVRVPAGKAMVHSVDFFRAFVDDPYLFGKIAANHSLGDIFAMGAQAQSATAIATVPPGLESKVEDLLFQMMTGAVEVLNEAGCALVGGHTGEGAELALGFAINGLIDDQPDALMRKGGMQSGDVLILTKPLGTGTLFAAHARLAAKGRWIDAALTSMVQSNRLGAQCLHSHGATACTDVTGFGLLGHLVEMTKPSGVDAQISLSALPLLDGAVNTVAAGIVSSLQTANVRLRRALHNQAEFVQHPRYPLLFDPQTAGGLLASVPADRAAACLAELHALGYGHAAVIGRVRPTQDAQAPIVLLK
jgi:selenide, water dikinase